MEEVHEFIRREINNDVEEAFFVVNVEDLINKHKQWKELLPRVSLKMNLKSKLGENLQISLNRCDRFMQSNATT